METKKPLPLQRQEKLKVYATVFTLKSVPPKSVQDKFIINLGASYNETDAFMGMIKSMEMLGKNPSDYYCVLKVVSDADQLIDFPTMPPVETLIEKPAPVIEDKQTVEEQMINDVRIMFRLVGNAKENKIADQIIEKFTEYSKSKLSTN